MKKFKTFLLLIPLLMSSQNLFAYNDGDLFTIDGFHYLVHDINQYEVTVLGTSKTGSIVIPDTVNTGDVKFTVTRIGADNSSHIQQFTWGTNVTAVRLPDCAKIIHMYAFQNASLTTLHLPASVDSIQMTFSHFSNLTKLQSITVDSGNSRFEAYDGVLYTKGKKTLIMFPMAKAISNGTYTIPDYVDSIIAGAFKTPSLVTLNIPASVKYIDTNAYSIVHQSSNPKNTAINVDGNNSYYKSIDGVVFTKDGKTLVKYPQAKHAGGSYTVPNGVTALAEYSFYKAQLTSINLNQVQDLSARIFYTAGLTSVTIPASVTIIGPTCFDTCPITSFSVAAANPYYKAVNGVLFTKDGKTLVKYPRSAAATFYSIPAGTEVIGNSAFFYAINLSSVTIPASLESIESLAFRDCHNISTLTFTTPSSLKTIEDRAFFQCYSLQNLTFPSSVEVIGTMAFANCSNLQSVTIADNSNLRTIGANAFQYCSAFKSFRFGNSCQLDTIGHGAFRDTQITSFDFPPSVRCIHGSAFSNTGITLSSLPPSIRTIGKEAFWNVKTAAALAIPAATDSISPEAFKGCYTLKALNVDKANQKYSSLGGMLLTKDKETLVLFPPGKAGEKFNLLAPSLRRIGDYAFYENQLLTSVIIPNRVTSLGKRAFGLCPNLNTVTLLCENYLDPANIAQLLNEATFDDGVTTTTDYRKNIALHVRKHLLSQYENEPYYDLYFKSIAPSFNPMKNPANAAEGLNANEEYITVSQNEASLIAASSPDETYVVPKTVNRNRLDQYTVAMVGDYAFHGCSPGTSEVVVPGEVSYVGAKAFLSDTASVAASTIKSIFLLAGPQDERTFSTTRFELDDTGNDYSEFANNTKVYVRKSTYNSADFQNAVTRYTVGNSVHPRTRNMFSYQIPGISITKSYGTFAREFDVDLSEYARELEEQYGPDAGGRVFAFAAPVDRQGSYFKPGGGDNPEAKGTYYVRFTSLEHTRADGTIADGTYIPANTGVLLKSWDGLTQTDDDFFYCIGEDGDGMAETPAQSFLVGVTRNKAEVKDTDRNIFVMSGGLFKPLNGQTVASFPLHKAYLKLDGFPGATTGAKVMLVFDDDTVPTTIGSPGADEGMDGTGDIHDLQGRRVTAPRKGIYVRNGKKIVIK